MKILLIVAGAAASLAAFAPALSQTAPVARQHVRVMSMQPLTRAAVAQKVQEHFAKIDADKDGFVTKAEADSAKDAMRVRIESRFAERKAGRFDQLDANKDGAISRQEFESAHSGQRHWGNHAMRGHGMRHMAGIGGHMFEMADLNKDSRVSLQEATQAALQHFDATDTNRDGTITPDEMRAAHAKMRAAS